MGTLSGGRSVWRAVVPAVLAAALVTPLACGDGVPTGVQRSLALVFQPVFATASPGASNAQLVDAVHLLVTDSEDEVVVDSIIDWPLEQDTLTIAITVSIESGQQETFTYLLEALAGDVTMFEMSGSVEIAGDDDGTDAVVTDTLVFVGPGAEAAGLRIDAPPDSMLAADTVRLRAVVTDQDGATMSVPVVWESVDTTVAGIDADGLVTARHLVGRTARVAARVQYRDDLTDSATIALLSGGTAFLPDAGPDTLHALEDTLTLTASALGADGQPAGGGRFTFQALDTAVAGIAVSTDSTARVRSRTNGTARFVATGEGYVDTATVVVAQRADHVLVAPGDTAFGALEDTIQLSATVYDYLDHPITTAPVDWSSEDSSVIAVDQSGRAWALQVGTVNIIASSGGVADTASVGVQQALADFRLVEDSVRFEALEQDSTFSASGFDANGNVIASLAVSWSSTDTAVAGVDPDGVVTARSQGTARVIASGGTLADTAVVVVDQRVAELTLAPGADTLDALQDTVTFTVEMLDPAGHPVTGATATWSCSDAAVLECGTGSAVAVGTGDAVVIAAAEGVADTAAIHVRQVATTLDVLQDSLRFDALQGRDTLTLMARDANDFELPPADVTWTSRSTTVAAVDTAGVVTAEGNGETWVVAASSGLRDSAVVRVQQVPTAVSVSPADTTAVLEADALIQVTYSAEITDANGAVVAGADVTWASSDTTVARFSEFFGASTVTAVGPGTTLISASTPAADTSVVGTARLVLVPPYVDVAPSFAVVNVGDQLPLELLALTGTGDTVVVPTPLWSSGAEAVASVDTAGLVTGLASGVAPIAAAIETYSDTGFVAVAGPDDLVSTAFAGRVDAALVPGTAIDVPITLDMTRVSADGDLGSVQLELGFDPAVVRYDSATVHADGWGSGTTNLPDDSTLSFAYAGTSPLGTGELTLLTVHFTVRSTAAAGDRVLLDLEHTARPSDTSFNEYALPISVDGRILVVNP